MQGYKAVKGGQGAEAKSTANIHGIDVKHGVRCKVQGAERRGR